MAFRGDIGIALEQVRNVADLLRADREREAEREKERHKDYVFREITRNQAAGGDNVDQDEQFHANAVRPSQQMDVTAGRASPESKSDVSKEIHTKGMSVARKSQIHHDDAHKRKITTTARKSLPNVDADEEGALEFLRTFNLRLASVSETCNPRMPTSRPPRRSAGAFTAGALYVPAPLSA